MKLLIEIAYKQLIARKRQSLVSFFGIVLGVAFYLAVSSLMKGSERDFINRLVDNSPHITISDEFRLPRVQPIFKVYKDGALQIGSIRPLSETRGIRTFNSIREYLSAQYDLRISEMLSGQGLVSFAGKDVAVTLNGMIPEDIKQVTTIQKYIVEGSIDDLILYPDGIVIGAELKRALALSLGESINIVSPTGNVDSLKVVGVFRTGRSNQDTSTAYLPLKKVQSLLMRPNRVNSMILKIKDPYSARKIAEEIESRIYYKSVSWQETSEDLMNTLAIRNRIMFTVVSAVLIVAAFGIYNVISTVVLEKYRDIAILKSIGFYASDIRRIFAVQGVILGLMGCALGFPLGMFFMKLLSFIKFKPPGSSQRINMPIDWSLDQFFIAGAFAMIASFVAAYLPARKAGKLEPVEILRGGAW